MIPETTWSYLAGMIDGEGYITIIRHHKSHCSKRGYEIETIMEISNMNINNLIELKQLIGMGRINIAKHKRQGGIIQVAYLRFSVADQRVIIPKILPYLMQKKERMNILKSFLDYRAQTKKPIEERELKYFEFEKQFEQSMMKAKPWMSTNSVSKKGRPHQLVVPPIMIQHLVPSFTRITSSDVMKEKKQE